MDTGSDRDAAEVWVYGEVIGSGRVFWRGFLKEMVVQNKLQMRGVCFLVLCLVFIGVDLPGMCLADEMADLYKRSEASFSRGDYDAAISCLDKLVKLNDPDAYYNRGVVYCQKNEFEKAIADLNEAIRQKPIAHAFEVRGNAYAGKQNATKAVEDYTEAINRDPKNGRIYLARAEQYLFFLNQVDAGLIDTHTAILLLSNSIEATNILSRAYYAQGFAYERKAEFDKAFEIYSKSIQLDSSNFLPYVNRGFLYGAKAQYEKAMGDYKEAIQIAPKASSAFNRLAWLKATCLDKKYRNYAEALPLAERACELTGWKDPNCLETYAAANAGMGEFDDAIAWEKTAITLGLTNRDLIIAQERLNSYKQHKIFDNP